MGKTIGINNISIITLQFNGNCKLFMFDDLHNVIFEKEYKTFSVAKCQQTKQINKILFIEKGDKVYRDSNTYFEIVDRNGKECFIANCFKNGKYFGGMYILKKDILSWYENRYNSVFFVQ